MLQDNNEDEFFWGQISNGVFEEQVSTNCNSMLGEVAHQQNDSWYVIMDFYGFQLATVCIQDGDCKPELVYLYTWTTV